jgi:ABC-type transport system involved in Fe-S cluster assembly fused permease/ATPase subunit
VVASAFLYVLFVITLIDTSPSPTIAHQITWSIALLAEILLLVVSVQLYVPPHMEFNSLQKGSRRMRKSISQWELIELIIDGIRVLLLIIIVGLYAMFSLQRMSRNRQLANASRTQPTETTPLLNNENGHANGSQETQQVNDHTNGAPPTAAPSGEPRAAFYRPVNAPDKTWWEYLKGYALFFPYLWPFKNRRLQVIVVICFLLVVMQRVVNVAVPYQMSVVTNTLSGENPQMPWLQISLLIGLKLVQGNSGLFGALRSVLWIPIGQFSYQALTTASFEHVHGLSLEFHLNKRTGEVLSALNKGSSINTFLEQVTFQVLPMLVDLILAIIYFLVAFDAYYGMVVFIVAFWYMYLTIRMAQWRAEQRRQMVNADREEDAVKNDSIQSYETVKYFGAEDYEFKRYRDAVKNYQSAEYQVLFSLNVMNTTQNLVFMTGLLVTSFIAAYQVTTGAQPVGQFVGLLAYMQQLQSPLNFFGTFYRSIQSAMISGERLLELFKEQPTVVDEPGTITLPTCEGRISFTNVKFSYDSRKTALQDLSFTCAPGTTTALVGESGGGKSTIFRLLFRFYNSQDGSIQLDGHDVRSISLASLRSHIGVVPQDTVLFNETLMYNLRYANQNATDEEVYAACRAASIHEKILAFPDGYATKVGERGLRLSGGEKQRVAIARTILKNPRIIMLDEATAALDSETEQHIQEALKTLSQGRTMLVIA